MAIVKNQDLPLEDIEDKLDPPIPFLEQYRRTLDEGIDHPKLPAGEEIVTYSKSWSRPATRSEGTSSPSEANQAWRDKFRECLDCWENQVDTEEELDECKSAGSRHYVEPWEYVPGAQNTYFNQFMKDCLDWAKANPGVPFPKCEDLEPSPNPFEYCAGDIIEFTVENGNGPTIVSVDCGTVIEGLQVQISGEEVGEECKVAFTDTDGRKGCALGTKKPDEQCCCATNPTVGITYTTLLMACNGVQDISVDPGNPGCPPYEWELTGGGSIQVLDEDTVRYTAPGTNPNCVNNPNIKLTDSCGSEAEIKIAVNCNTAAFNAYKVTTCTQPANAGTSIQCIGAGSATCCLISYRRQGYRCNGVAYQVLDLSGQAFLVSQKQECCAMIAASHVSPLCQCWYNPTPPCCDSPNQKYHKYVYADYCGDAYDNRTQAQKDAGCCPLNPKTGLPF